MNQKIKLNDEASSYLIQYQTPIFKINEKEFQELFSKYFTLPEVVVINPYNNNQLITVPRREEFFSDNVPVYSFAKRTIKAKPFPDEHTLLGSLLNKFVLWVKHTCIRMDGDLGIWVNYYQGNDHISKHSDDEKSIVKGAPIFSVSLEVPGEERYLEFYEKNNSTKVANVIMYDACVVGMFGRTQQTHQHCVKKATNKIQKEGIRHGRRINFTALFFQNNRQKLWDTKAIDLWTSEVRKKKRKKDDM